MIVRVKLFAGAKQLANAEVIDIQLPEQATVADLRTAISQQFPQLTPILRSALFAIDTEYKSDSAVIPPQAEVACIPPVSGG